MFQDQVDLAGYELNLSDYRFDLAHHLAGQPLRFMMQVRACIQTVLSILL